MNFISPISWTSDKGEKIFQMEYFEEQDMVYVEINGHFKKDEFINFHEKVLQLIKDSKCEKLVHQGHFYPKDINAVKIWIINQFKTRACDLGLKKWAIISDGDLGFQLLADSYFKFRKKDENAYDVKIFDKESKAFKWINK